MAELILGEASGDLRLVRLDNPLSKIVFGVQGAPGKPALVLSTYNSKELLKA